MVSESRGDRCGGKDFIKYFALLYPVMSLRFLYYGFTYFRQLDDYIQYFDYEHFGGPKLRLIKDLGLLAARPLAGLMDLFVWARFYDNMITAVLTLTALYAAAATLLFLMFRRHFGVGYVFLVVFCLLPMGFEGTYWVSASSRILCGLFFAVAAVWFLQRFADYGKWYYVLLFALLQLVSFGFYEQAIFFSFALTLGITLMNVRSLRWRALWALLWFPNVSVYMAFTSRFIQDSSLYGQRMQLVLPNTPYYFKVFLPEVLQQLKSAFLGSGLFITLRGFFRGWHIMLQDRAWVYALCVVGAAVLLFLFARRESLRLGKQGLAAPLIGIVLVAAPISPFFVLQNPWFSIRNTVMSFAGIGLILESLLTFLLAPADKRGIMLKPMIAAAAVLVFLTASVAELNDYRATTENDVAIVQNLYSVIKDVPEATRIVVLNLNPSYLPEQSYYYHEHIHGVTESDWALTGALRAIGNGLTPYVTPIASTQAVYGPFDQFDKYDLSYLFDGDHGFVPLKTESLGHGLFNYYDTDGDLRAQIRRDDNGRGILVIQGD